MVWNPTDRERAQPIPLDLYYAGLVDRATAVGADSKEQEVVLDRRGRTRLPVTVPAGGAVWFALR